MSKASFAAAVLLPFVLWADGGAVWGADPSSPDPVQRGEYVFIAAGCHGCHTDEKNGGAPLAGGRAMKTPFGTFHTPNITPDPQHGIGRWSDADFVQALRHGREPDGEALFPAFPYTSYTKMSERDLLDLRAYLMTRPPVAAPNRPHDLTPPFGWRFLLPVWQWLHLEEGTLADDPAKPAEWNRGRYLVEALGHCGECHSPRGLMGGMDHDRALAGNPNGPDGDKVPGLRPGVKGAGELSVGEIETVLELGMQPDGDFVGGAMGEVVRNTTSKLTPADRHAIAVYLKSLPPVH
ncbi:MAG TPA: cytochrome c [Azospirillum sp.]|nr:cytochrome c [Azospirillum sp.]